jgi:hypothetical protein
VSVVAALLLAAADRVNNPTPARTEFSSLVQPASATVCSGHVYRQLSPYTQMATGSRGRVEVSLFDAESAPAWPPFE